VRCEQAFITSYTPHVRSGRTGDRLDARRDGCRLSCTLAALLQHRHKTISFSRRSEAGSSERSIRRRNRLYASLNRRRRPSLRRPSWPSRGIGDTLHWLNCGNLGSPVYKIFYVNLMIMPKLRSTYDGRLTYKTSYEGRKAFLRYDSLAKL